MKNTKEFIREKVQEMYDEGYEFYDIHHNLFGEDNVENWPVSASDDGWRDDGDDGDNYTYDYSESTEPQDMENFEWLEINEDDVVVCCGGDWQEPIKITMTFDGKKLIVVEQEDGVYEEGMEEKEFNETLGVVNPNYEE